VIKVKFRKTVLVREDTRRKCCQTVAVEPDISEGRETSEDGGGKGGKIVGIKTYICERG